MNESIFINRLSAWAPGIENSSQWNEWALGKREILCTGKDPELSFMDSLFKRRLSQVSKMTIQVTHDLMPIANDTKIFFFSFRGELSKQFKVNKMLIQEKTLSPSVFSQSVFNAPVALASMAMGLKGGYCAIYPGNNSLKACVLTAAASLLGGTANEAVFIYADEEAPPEYECFFNEAPCAAAFALLLTKLNKSKGRGTVSCGIPLLLPEENENPLFYLKRLLCEGINVSS